MKVDLLGGEARTEAFRRINPFGRVPYLVEGGFGLAESNAILLHLAQVFFEQNQIEPSLATLRFMLHVRKGHRSGAAAWL